MRVLFERESGVWYNLVKHRLRHRLERCELEASRRRRGRRRVGILGLRFRRRRGSWSRNNDDDDDN